MAEATKEKKVSKARRKPASLQIEELYMLSKPEKVKGRDGRTHEIFHRVGAAGGAYTKSELMQKCGYSAQLAEVERDANRRYKNIAEARAVVESREVKLKNVLNSRVAACKSKLARDYAQAGLIPLMASVRIHSETEERKLFIQGFVNKDGEFVIGSRDDGALWAIEVLNGGRGIAERFKLAHSVGKDLVNKGMLSAPVKERLALTLKA